MLDYALELDYKPRLTALSYILENYFTNVF